MRLTQGLERAALCNRTGVAVVEGEVQRTWADIHDRVKRTAGGLVAAGVKLGDRVAVLSGNNARYFELFFAVPWAGGVIVPLNTRLTFEELAFMLSDSGARALFVSAEFETVGARLLAETHSLETLIKLDDEGTCLGYEAWMSDASPVEDAGREREDLAGIFYTGGTTGRPKGVMLSHLNLVANALSLLTFLEVDRSTINVHAAPMFHLADIGIYCVTMAGGRHVFLPQIDAVSLLDSIETHGITHCMTVPTMIDRLTKEMMAKPRDVSSLRMLGYGGSPMPGAVMEKARKTFPGIRFIQGYGMTEAPGFTFLGPDYHTLDGPLAGKMLSAGEPIYTFDVRILDPDGNEVPRGEKGEICARGPNVMQGYWNNQEATDKTIRDGWLHTGDVGFMDEDGFVTVTDRIKDMIVTGGENVYSLEVENIIYRHLQVDACAVIGIPSEVWGEAVHAIVVPKPGAIVDTEGLLEFCRDRLAGYKVPKSIEIRETPLPLTPSGKVRKADLRAPYWSQAGGRS